MGFSSNDSSTRTNSTTSENATTRPLIPNWIEDSMMLYNGRVDDFAMQDPSSMVAGPSNLQTQAWNAAANNLNPSEGANLAASQGYTAANPGNPLLSRTTTLTPSQGYTAANAGPAQQAGAVGPMERARAEGYTAANAAPVNMGAANQATAQQAEYQSFMDGGIDKYLNPNTDNVVNTTLADMDVNASRVRAQQLADGARNGALGGSRFGLAQGITEGELGRARASAGAQLRSNAYESAVRGAQFDASNRLDASKLNAQLGTQTNLSNAGWQNQRTEAQGSLDANLGMYNSGQTNTARQFGANANNQASMFNAGQQNLGTLKNADIGMFNAGQSNQFALDAAGRTDAASQFGANASNQFALTQGQMNQQNNQFNATTQNNAVQHYMDRTDAASQFGANASNQFALNQGQMDQQNNQFNNNQYRNDLSMMSQFGAQDRQIQQEQALAPLMHLQAQGQLYGLGQHDMFDGQSVRSNSTSSGTSTTSQTPSMFNQLLAAAQAAAAFSERRVKRDIKRIGEHRGLGIYNYRYIWDDKLRVGVMADEVAKVAPDALGPVIQGIQTVNYGKLDLAHLVEA